MSEGGKPGITARIKIVAVNASDVTFTFVGDVTEYFKVGEEFMAKFVPVEEKKDSD